MCPVNLKVLIVCVLSTLDSLAFDITFKLKHL